MNESKITLYYLTWLERNLGRASETISLSDRICTVDDVLDHLQARGGAYDIFSRRHVIFANIDNAIVPHAHALSGVKSISFFSPIVGG